MRRILAVTTLAVALAACTGGPGGPTTPPETVATPSPTFHVVVPPISVTGATKTGVSKAFNLPAGSYAVQWSVKANKADCAFYLYLATKANGPTVEDVPIQILPSVRTYDGTVHWTSVAGGTYVLQEDRSGLANCTGAWSATITQE